MNMLERKLAARNARKAFLKRRAELRRVNELAKPTVQGVLPGEPQGLMPKALLKEPLKVGMGGLRFQVQQSVDSVEPIGCQQLQMIRQHFNREFPAQCLTRSGVEQVGNLVQPLLANQRQIGALG
ncbi:hypothetical protein SAMN04490192_3549 [Pseudomonas lundensis]|nr:hypothetical protein SAMN04490192_3549 [Pseudomonas lundensis]